MSAIPADLRLASPWRWALPSFLLLALAIVLTYRDTALAMVAIWWRSETFNHALLVLPISLWLVWRQRETLAALTPRAAPGLLLAMVVVLVVWMLSRLVIVDAASQFAFVTVLILAVPAVLGTQVAKVILFPLLFLFFGVPFGEFVLPTMMEWTADFTVTALRLTGVPVFREGQQFVIPTGSWSVIDECSGVRYLMASFMVGTLFAYLNYRSYRRRAAFMLMSLLVPVLANWVRAYMVVMLAYLSENRIATGVDHILYGWVFFGLIIFLMFVVGARWSEAPAKAATALPSGPLVSAACLTPAGLRMLIIAATGVLIVQAPPLALATMARGDRAATALRFELPTQLAPGWSDRGVAAADWLPLFDNPSVQASRSYTGAASTVGVYVAYYHAQDESRKLVSSQNMLVPMRGSAWNLMPGATEEVATGSGTIAVRTAELLRQPIPGSTHRPHLVAWRFYWIDGRFYAGDIAAKIGSAVARLQGHGDDGAAIVLYADAQTPHEATVALQAFARDNLERLSALLQQTRDAR